MSKEAIEKIPIIEELSRKYRYLIQKRSELYAKFVKAVRARQPSEILKQIKEEIRKVEDELNEIKISLLLLKSARVKAFLEEYAQLCKKYLLYIDARVHVSEDYASADLILVDPVARYEIEDVHSYIDVYVKLLRPEED